jgi:F-type H+-transporting ATPase subunit b
VEALNVDVGLMVWTLLTFAGLLALLSRFAFRPLRRILGEREARMQEALQKAEEARAQAQQVLERSGAQIEEARAEARRIIAEGQKIAAQVKRETKDSARQDAAVIVREAQAEIEREVLRNIDELRGTVASLSLRIARQVITEEMDDKRHDRLVTEFIDRLKESRGRSGQ